MEKRLLLAIALSLLILVSWSAFMSKTYHVENKEVTTSVPADYVLPKAQIRAELPSEKPSPLPPLHFTHQDIEFNFNEAEAAIESVIFKGHKEYEFVLRRGLFLDEDGLVFKRSGVNENAISFVHLDQSKKVTKSYSFPNSLYYMELDVEVQNLTPSALTLKMPLIIGSLDFSTNMQHQQFQDVVALTDEKTVHQNGKKDWESYTAKYLSIRDRYFCIIVEPQEGSALGFIKKVSPKETSVGFAFSRLDVPANQKISKKFYIYLGPQEISTITAIKSSWASIINYGTFDIISQMLLQLLRFIYAIVHNWGWAIIILSILVYLILFPLSIKQMHSMKEMQRIQPLVEEIRKKHKDNPQKLNKEIMELYREHKINPLGGCLPLILQMPIFFALYQAMMRSVVLKGATFLWIKDLSEPDRLFTLPNSLPILGNEINILPILMTIGMFIQQKTSTVAATGSSAEQQKIMMIVMPIMFGFIFYRMPSGLVLYWFVNSMLMLLYQIKINRKQ